MHEWLLERDLLGYEPIRRGNSSDETGHPAEGELLELDEVLVAYPHEALTARLVPRL